MSINLFRNSLQYIILFSAIMHIIYATYFSHNYDVFFLITEISILDFLFLFLSQ